MTRPRSSCAWTCRSAPFWGAKTAAAPRAPSSGLSTSVAAISSHPARRGSSSLRSARSRAERPPPPPGAAGCPWRSLSRAPSACSSPAPPSVLAVPPTPTTSLRQPASRAARMSLADPEAGGRQGCAGAVRACPESAGLRGLDDGHRPADRDPHWHGMPVGSCYPAAEHGKASGQAAVDCAFPAVGYRQDPGLGHAAGLQTAGERFGCLDGGQAAPELVWADQNPGGDVSAGRVTADAAAHAVGAGRV